MKVDFYRHDLGRADADAIADVLASPFLTTGSVSRAVEAELSRYFSLPHALLVNSWTNGALAVLLAMDLAPGDEVIVPAMTFIATANAAELAGAHVVFADVDPDTLLLTPELAARCITARTRCIIPVHLYGQMCDIAGLRAMLEAHPAVKGPVRIVEDCAHCFEGEREGCKPGRYSDAAVFSFYATKNITCGEGGAIVTRDAALYQRVLETRLHGMSAIAVDRFAGGRYRHWDMKRLGTKANLPDLLAALLPRQIATIDERLPARQALASRYRQAFADGPLRLVAPIQSCKSAEHIFTIGVPGSPGLRDEVIAALNDSGIGVTVNYNAVPDVTFYRQRYPAARDACPVAQAWGSQTITLPLFPSMLPEEQEHVISVVKTKIYDLINSR